MLRARRSRSHSTPRKLQRASQVRSPFQAGGSKPAATPTRRRRPEWDGTIHDLAVYKLSKEEQVAKMVKLISPNNALAFQELERKFGGFKQLSDFPDAVTHQVRALSKAVHMSRIRTPRSGGGTSTFVAATRRDPSDGELPVNHRKKTSRVRSLNRDDRHVHSHAGASLSQSDDDDDRGDGAVAVDAPTTPSSRKHDTRRGLDAAPAVSDGDDRSDGDSDDSGGGDGSDSDGGRGGRRHDTDDDDATSRARLMSPLSQRATPRARRVLASTASVPNEDHTHGSATKSSSAAEVAEHYRGSEVLMRGVADAVSLYRRRAMSPLPAFMGSGASDTASVGRDSAAGGTTVKLVHGRQSPALRVSRSPGGETAWPAPVDTSVLEAAVQKLESRLSSIGPDPILEGFRRFGPALPEAVLSGAAGVPTASPAVTRSGSAPHTGDSSSVWMQPLSPSLSPSTQQREQQRAAVSSGRDHRNNCNSDSDSDANSDSDAGDENDVNVANVSATAMHRSEYGVRRDGRQRGGDRSSNGDSDSDSDGDFTVRGSGASGARVTAPHPQVHAGATPRGAAPSAHTPQSATAMSSAVMASQGAHLSGIAAASESPSAAPLRYFSILKRRGTTPLSSASMLSQSPPVVPARGQNTPQAGTSPATPASAHSATGPAAAYGTVPHSHSWLSEQRGQAPAQDDWPMSPPGAVYGATAHASPGASDTGVTPSGGSHGDLSWELPSSTFTSASAPAVPPRSLVHHAQAVNQGQSDFTAPAVHWSQPVAEQPGGGDAEQRQWQRAGQPRHRDAATLPWQHDDNPSVHAADNGLIPATVTSAPLPRAVRGGAGHGTGARASGSPSDTAGVAVTLHSSRPANHGRNSARAPNTVAAARTAAATISSDDVHAAPTTSPQSVRGTGPASRSVARHVTHFGTPSVGATRANAGSGSPNTPLSSHATSGPAATTAMSGHGAVHGFTVTSGSVTSIPTHVARASAAALNVGSTNTAARVSAASQDRSPISGRAVTRDVAPLHVTRSPPSVSRRPVAITSPQSASSSSTMTMQHHAAVPGGRRIAMTVVASPSPPHRAGAARGDGGSDDDSEPEVSSRLPAPSPTPAHPTPESRTVSRRLWSVHDQ